MEMTLNNGFCEMSQDECINIDGGVAPFLIYTIVIADGLAAGYVFGYFGGEKEIKNGKI